MKRTEPTMRIAVNGSGMRGCSSTWIVVLARSRRKASPGRPEAIADARKR